MAQKSRLTYLEGMRGLMAINVMLCHFTCIYLPEMFYRGYDSALSCFATTPLSALINGNIAVMFFFALTGFLVGRSVFIKKTDIETLPTKLCNRYLRLLPVVAIATFFTFLTMRLGLQYHLDITNENVSTEVLSLYCNFDASFSSLILNSFFLPFVDNSAYINPFWTLCYEFWGYFIVLVMAMSFKSSKWRRLFYIGIMVVMEICLNTNYCVFIMGLFVADLEYNTNSTIFNKLYERIIRNKAFLTLCFFVSTYFACCPLYEDTALYSFWFRLPLLNHTLLRGFGIALFIWVALNSRLIQKILSIKPLVSLGEVSFETYALHWPIMLSCEAGLFLILERHLSYYAAAILSFLITVIVVYISSYLLNALVSRINKAIYTLRNKKTAEAVSN